MTKQFKIALVVLLIAAVALVLGNYYLQRWTDAKMFKVSLGMAENTFPWRDYTEAELAKMYPQIKYAEVPTRVTPEQTYAKFRQALKENNLELAVEQLSRSSGKRFNENKDYLTKMFNENKFSQIYKKYPEKIEKSTVGEAIAQYYFLKNEEGHNLRQYIEFFKDANGDWKMDSL